MTNDGSNGVGILAVTCNKHVMCTQISACNSLLDFPHKKKLPPRFTEQFEQSVVLSFKLIILFFLIFNGLDLFEVLPPKGN